MAVELLERVRAEIDARLAELRPSVAEYERLIGVTDALGDEPSGAGGPPNSAPPRKAATRPKVAARPKVATDPKRTGGLSGAAGRAARAPASRSATAKSDSAARQAIVAALEHGSHTVSELVLVSALPGAQIRAGLRPLLKSGTVTRATREGRLAYALARTA